MSIKINPKIYKVFNHLYDHLSNDGYNVDMESTDNGKMIININMDNSTSVICIYTIRSDEFVYVSVTNVSLSDKNEVKLVITIDTIRNKIIVYYTDKVYTLDYSDKNIAALVQNIIKGKK